MTLRKPAIRPITASLLLLFIGACEDCDDCEATGTCPNDAPEAQISQPAPGTTAEEGTPITFAGSATDPEDGSLSGAALVWSSSRDGGLGTGSSFSRSDLSPGEHAITLTATDSKGRSGTASVAISIETLEEEEEEEEAPELGPIIFAALDGFGSPNLFAMREDGTDVVQLTPNSECPDGGSGADWPRWSPDGSSIVFNHVSGLVALAADGSSCSTILSAGSRTILNSSAWSPDGQRIAYCWLEGALDWGISILGVAAADETRIHTGQLYGGFECDLDWSPDGRFVSYRASQETEGDTYVRLIDLQDANIVKRYAAIDATGGNQRNGAWSPDGSRIAFSYSASLLRNRIGILEFATNTVQTYDIGELFISSIRWSPDSQSIVFSAGPVSGDDEIGVLHLSSGELRNLTQNSGVSETNPDWRRF